MSRLFVATFLERENADSIISFQQEYSKTIANEIQKPVKATGRNALHITWHFLGEVEDEEIEELKEALSLSVKKLSLTGPEDLNITYDRFEIWPNKKRPRLGVALATSPPDAVLSLARAIQGASKSFSDSEPRKHFKPHLTVFRVKERQDAHRRKIETGSKSGLIWQPISQKIDRVELVKSDLGKGPPVYTSLMSLTIG